MSPWEIRISFPEEIILAIVLGTEKTLKSHELLRAERRGNMSCWAGWEEEDYCERLVVVAGRVLSCHLLLPWPPWTVP